MTQKHTPGPWSQATYSKTDIVSDSGTMIAMARDGLNGITRDQAINNARLIAAAPDLLAALENLLHTESCDAWNIKYAIEQAQFAIAKAKGE